MEKKYLVRKKLILGILLVALVFAAVIGVAQILDSREGKEAVAETDGSEDGVQKIFYNGEWYCQRDDVSSVLFIGIDKFEDYSVNENKGITNSQQCDFLGLLVIDEASESYKVIQINRDTMTEVPILGIEGYAAGSKNEQIALAHTYGSGGDDSCKNTADAVSALLFGTPVLHYASFVMDAVPVVNDAAGGVTVKIENDFGASDPDFVKGQTITLNGEQALRFVRSRMEMEDNPTNIARMERQRVYLSQLKNQIFDRCQNDSSFMIELLGDVGQYMTSNLSVNQLSDIFYNLKDYKFEGFVLPEGEPSQGTEFAEFYVDDEALKKMVVETFYRQC